MTFNILRHKSQVFKSQSASWAPLGNELTGLSTGNPSICGLSTTRVALTATNYDVIETYDWDGSDWSKTGNSYSYLIEPTNQKIAGLSGSRIVSVEPNEDAIQTYDFDGTDWSPVGNALDPGTIVTGDVAAMSSTRIAIMNSGSDLRAYDFDGMDWSTTGNTYELGALGAFPSVCGMSSSRVAVFDVGIDELVMLEFDGTDWSEVGNAYSYVSSSSTGGECDIARLNANRVALIDRGVIKTFDFDGTDWASYGDTYDMGSVQNCYICNLSGLLTDTDTIVYKGATGSSPEGLRCFQFTDPES